MDELKNKKQKSSSSLNQKYIFNGQKNENEIDRNEVKKILQTVHLNSEIKEEEKDEKNNEESKSRDGLNQKMKILSTDSQKEGDKKVKEENSNGMKMKLFLI
jgi:hypothetical protein